MFCDHRQHADSDSQNAWSGLRPDTQTVPEIELCRKVNPVKGKS